MRSTASGIVKFAMGCCPILLATPLFAAGSGEAFHVPTVVYFQVFNFGLLLILLHLLLRKTVVSHFAARRQIYLEARSRAMAQREAAEQDRQMIAARLDKLTETAEQAVQEARDEAERLRQQALSEAQNMVRRLRDEAQRTIQYELQKSIHELREQLINEAIEQARGELATLEEVQRQALHKEFVEKIQVVQ